VPPPPEEVSRWEREWLMGRESPKSAIGERDAAAVPAGLVLEAHVLRLEVAVDDARAGVREVQPVAVRAA
jgi:hypothetical protein